MTFAMFLADFYGNSFTAIFFWSFPPTPIIANRPPPPQISVSLVPNYRIYCFAMKSDLTDPYCLRFSQCFREKNKFRDFCRDFSTCTLVVCAWTAIVLLCVSKTVRTFADTDHPNSVSDGLSMALVSIIVIIVLCWWLMLFQS